MAEVSTFDLNAGHRVLDFLNTWDNTAAGAKAVESLPDYTALLRFADSCGLLAPAVLRALRQTTAKAQTEAHRKAIALREALRRIFEAIVRQRTIPNADIAVLNEYICSAASHRSLVKSGAAIGWNWREAEEEADSPLWPLAFEAGELLVSDRLQFVGECRNPECGWLFLDLSKNHSRRWCDMKGCGNRAKARSYYQRVRELDAEA